MSKLKKIFTLIILPLSAISIVAIIAFTVNHNYYKSQMTAIHHNDKTIIANKTKKYVDYALSKGKTTIDKASIQTTLNDGNYTTTGVINNKSVSVNTSTKPVITNGKATVYSLSSKAYQYVTSIADVHKSAKEKAKLDRQLATVDDDIDISIDNFLVQLIISLIVAGLVVFGLFNLTDEWPSLHESK